VNGLNDRDSVAAARPAGHLGWDSATADRQG
jgi:hypothetical protein